MLVGEWMSKNVVTMSEDSSMLKAARVMKDRGIRRIPVVDDKGLLTGIVTERDIKAASPSKATSLDMYELTYLLSEITVRDIMTRNPLRVSPGDTVERAAVILRDNRVGGLPVVDQIGRVVGFITDTDIFRVYTMISGVDLGGIQFGVRLPMDEGSLTDLLEDLRGPKARVISLLTRMDRDDTGERDIFIRIQSLSPENEKTLKGVIESKHTLLYWVKD